MSIIFGIIGFFLGLFLWSTIFGRVIEIQQTKKVRLPNDTFTSLLSIFISLVVISLGSLLLNGFMSGVILSGVVMLFNLGNLKREVIENIQKKHGWQ